tara:strand:+ start:86 stop:643 length:558 start_codon:yes stop_codon:yes gene_type:complete
MRHFLSLLIFIFSLLLPSAYANESAWSLLEEGGMIVFIRHAYAPGGGDPDNFVLEDCSTQRNLNQQGINQSIYIGQEFSKRGIPVQQVYSSQWCRCKDTASFAFGDYKELNSLNSTFEGEYRQNHQRQIQELKELIASWNNTEGNLILVTHYVIIGGALGYYPSSGELVITDKNLEVLDSIKTKY